MPSLSVPVLNFNDCPVRRFTHANTKLQDELKEDRILGALFDENLCADDIIIHSKGPETLEKLLRVIEAEGEKYGLKLNKRKFEHLAVNGNGKNL